MANPGPVVNQTTNLQPIVGSFDNSGNLIQAYGPGGVVLSLQSNDILGTTTNDNAPAGYIGELVTATVAVGSAVSLSTGVAKSVLSMSLTAGDWDVTGIVYYHGGASTNVSDLKQGVSTTDATFGAAGSFSYNYVLGVITDDPAYVTPPYRVSIAATTTVYIVALGDFTVSTLSAYGHMRARRMR